jgi:VCBS repeat-containing protein
VGVDDAYAVDEGATVAPGVPGVLSNDILLTSQLGTPTAVLVSGVSNGVLTLNSNGSFSYTHDGSETTADSFTYRPVQGGVDGTVATVSITINPVNDAPVAQDDGPFGVANGGELVKAAPGVLSNDTDAEDGGLTAVLKTGVSNGTLVLNADGSFTYTHDGSDTTADSFTYQAKDAGDKLSNVATVSLAIGAVVQPVHLTGLVDTGSGKWYLYDESGVLVTSFFYGNPGDYPFMGDWDGDGIETPGLYRQSDGFVYLKNTNTQGNADVSFFFGNPGDVPIAGDFNGDGSDTVSIYRPSNQTFFIINELGQDGGGLGAAEFEYVFGNPGDKPFVGDFNGNGIETVGLHRESTGLVYFRNTHTQGNADNQFIFGDPGDRLIAGDWTGDGVFTPALFRPSNTTMFFRHTNSQGNADNQFVPSPANPTWLPVSGKR